MAKKRTAKKINRITRFKIWCVKRNLTQRQIRKDTNLSIGTIHSMWYKGKANESNMKLISLVYKIEEEKLKRLITEFDNSED
jgi:hypothetical protein